MAWYGFGTKKNKTKQKHTGKLNYSLHIKCSFSTLNGHFMDTNGIFTQKQTEKKKKLS